MSTIKAFIFDQDGVIIDTEKDGHRVAFNKTFRDFGYDFTWGVEEYHELLQIAGGKERMRHYLHTKGFGKPVSPEEEDDLIRDLHKHKTEVFIELIESGDLPLRAGIKRLMQEINDLGLVLGVCTTSNQRSAQAVAYKTLKEIEFDFVLAGDVVSKKKPDPEIYNLALSKTGLAPEECLVIEDSQNGVLAAHRAGMHIVATVNFYTSREDLSLADIVVTNLGDPDGEMGELLSGGEGLKFDGVLYANSLVTFFSEQAMLQGR
jgi:HAD superfamily hydrolase (TIGR01509 family)